MGDKEKTKKEPEGCSRTPRRILAVGAHPDDIEYGCGAILIKEAERGNTVRMLVLSRGEAGSNGSPEERVGESEAAAALIGSTIEFMELEGDARIEGTPSNALKIARVVRSFRPQIVLAPSLDENQHPDHWKAGKLTRDACRLANYGGLGPLRERQPHAVSHLYYYGVTKSPRPFREDDRPTLLIDISDVHEKWNAVMQCHASQLRTRNYLDLQNARARLLGLSIGVAFAMELHPNDPIRLSGISDLTLSSRKF